ARVTGSATTALSNMIFEKRASISKTSMVCVPKTLVKPNSSGSGERHWSTVTECSNDVPRMRWHTGRAHKAVTMDTDMDMMPTTNKVFRIRCNADAGERSLAAVI